ncbi:MAG: metal-dependent hydrolase [Planctomycetota bacterium]
MNPLTHLLAGWLVANTAPLSRRDRALVTLSGVIPDIDGLGIIANLVTRGSPDPLDGYWRFHHTLGHNLAFCLVVTAAAWCLASRRRLAAGLAFLSFHLHLLGDVLGSGGGPGSYQWSIPYLAPFSDTLQIVWRGQWALNAWPNIVITGLLLAATFYLAWRRGFSPVQLISRRADAIVVDTLRARFGLPRDTCEPTADVG